MKQWPLFLAIFFLFFLDLTLLALFYQQYFYIILCTYITLLYAPTPKIAPLMLTALLIGTESSLLYGQYGPTLIYLLPITALSLWAQKSVYATYAQPYFILILAIGAHTTLLNSIPLGSIPEFFYTKSKIIGMIIGNIAMIWFIARSLNIKRK